MAEEIGIGKKKKTVVYDMQAFKKKKKHDLSASLVNHRDHIYQVSVIIMTPLLFKYGATRSNFGNAAGLFYST